MAGDPTDLCLLADVEGWLSIPSPNGPQAALLTRLVTATSRFVSSFLRPPPLGGLLAMAYNETRNGNGRRDLDFLNTPAFAVSGLSLNTGLIPAAPSPIMSGYIFDANTISLEGDTSPSLIGPFGTFGPRWLRQNVTLQYSAGYTLPNQANPSNWGASTGYAFGATIKPASGNAGNFIFVCTVAGTSAGSAPTWPQTGSTTVPDGTATWINLGVTTMPAPLPLDITQATIELVALRSRERNRIGYVSEHIDGQTISYWMRGSMTPSIREALQPYQIVTPVY